MSPNVKVVSDPNQEGNASAKNVQSEDVDAAAKSPELVDSGNDSDRLISSEDDEADEGDALKDSDEDGDGTLHIPLAAIAARYDDDDAPERPPPNKKHKCLQVVINQRCAQNR